MNITETFLLNGGHFDIKQDQSFKFAKISIERASVNVSIQNIKKLEKRKLFSFLIGCVHCKNFYNILI